MEIIHTGLAASSEENADRFYIDIVGLEKSEPEILEKKLTQAIFGINYELLIIHYQGSAIHYEILIYQGHKAPEKQIAHSCIKVPDLADIVNKCRDAGMNVIEVPKGSVIVTFISDYDGNLFEVKE